MTIILLAGMAAFIGPMIGLAALETLCKHEETEYYPGNYHPGYGWEWRAGVYCLHCGERLSE